MNLRFSFDDHHILNLKIAELLKKYHFPAIFYIPLSRADFKMISSLAQDFEIGGHTIIHFPLTEMPLNLAQKEIKNCKEILERFLGKQIKSFCYPRGRYNPLIKQIILKAGFLEARTTKILHLNKPLDPFETHTTIHCYQRKEYQDRYWLDVAKEYFLKAKKIKGYYHLWGHAWEIERDNNWKPFEEILKFIYENISG